MYGTILDVGLVCQVVGRLDRRLHSLYGEKRRQVGRVGRDYDESERPPKEWENKSFNLYLPWCLHHSHSNISLVLFPLPGFIKSRKRKAVWGDRWKALQEMSGVLGKNHQPKHELALQ